MAALALLAACWTAQPQEPAQPSPRPPRLVRANVGCWTKQFYEQWPRQVWLGDITAACELEYPGEYDRIATCVVVQLSREYDRVWAWNVRWFEACSPRS